MSVVFVFLIIVPGFAEINPVPAQQASGVKDVGFANRHTVRVAVNKNDDSFYLTRAEFLVDYNFPQSERIIRILPFFEYQHNLETGSWWRREVGAEIGSSFFNDCFYYGASFQHVWQVEENYPDEPIEETTEWESRFVISPPIPWGIFKDKVKLRLFDEYTFDFSRGQATFNAVGVIFDWQIYNWLKMPIGWRHEDRVHDLDSDLMEISLVFSF